METIQYTLRETHIDSPHAGKMTVSVSAKINDLAPTEVTLRLGTYALTMDVRSARNIRNAITRSLTSIDRATK